MSRERLAVLGGVPMFERPVPIGQLYFPSWERYTEAFRGIFDRQYYTNHGPLVQQLEERLRSWFGVRHAVCVTNATVGLMIAADALGLKGKVVVPSFTFIASALSLTWTGLEPVFCDVDPETHHLDPAGVAELIDEDVSGIMAVNLWGGACDVAALEAVAARKGVQLYFDSAHAVGCSIGDARIGRFGRLEVFSFHATKILSATEGGCICTNDDKLAARLRNIRSSYGAGRPVEVLRTANGRMSEAQAAVALMSLDDFDANRANNERLFARYAARLAEIPGLRLLVPSGVSQTNFQYVVCKVDEATYGVSRDALFAALRAENVLARRYFYPGIHRSIPFDRDYPQYLDRLPVTDAICTVSIQLPIGALAPDKVVEGICDLLASVHRNAGEIQSRVAEAGLLERARSTV